MTPPLIRPQRAQRYGNASLPRTKVTISLTKAQLIFVEEKMRAHNLYRAGAIARIIDESRGIKSQINQEET
ncbi:MAG: hypothetical protein LW834_06795 [Cyanobium sp. 49614_E6]|nr:hypothetical protein [Cyanobium sp. 49614_E6]MCE2836653.1 hypothetical protein [Cyanobium sp. 49614_E6]